MMQYLRWALILLFMTTLQVSAATDFDHRGLAKATIENFLRPQSESFADAAGKLAESVSGLCAKPSKQTLADAHDAFEKALQSYARIELFAFGPTRQEYRPEKLLLYPDPKSMVHNQVDEVIEAKDNSVLSHSDLAGKSVALQGFSALELLLYGTRAKQLLAASDDGQFECQYASAIASNIHAIAGDIRDGWNDPDGYSKLMLNPSDDNPAYLEQNEVTLEIVMAFANGIETMRDLRLVAPLGLRRPPQAPTPPPFETSGLMSPLMAGNIEGLIDFYVKSGLRKQFLTADEFLPQMVQDELETALQAAREADTSIPGALTNRPVRSKLIAMGFPLKNARNIFATLVARSTQLSVGFNAGDGD